MFAIFAKLALAADECQRAKQEIIQVERGDKVP
jgi:hypothetical protein